MGFVSEETLEKDRQCIYTVKILNSKSNNISIGIVPQGYTPEAGITAS